MRRSLCALHLALHRAPFGGIKSLRKVHHGLTHQRLKFASKLGSFCQRKRQEFAQAALIAWLRRTVKVVLRAAEIHASGRASRTMHRGHSAKAIECRDLCASLRDRTEMPESSRHNLPIPPSLLFFENLDGMSERAEFALVMRQLFRAFRNALSQVVGSTLKALNCSSDFRKTLPALCAIEGILYSCRIESRFIHT